MTITTKYSLEDKVYFMRKNSVTFGYVTAIYVSLTYKTRTSTILEDGSVQWSCNYDKETSYTIDRYPSDSCTDESLLFGTKKDLLNSL